MVVQWTLPVYNSIFNCVSSAYGDQIKTQNRQKREGRIKNKWEGLTQNRERLSQKKMRKTELKHSSSDSEKGRDDFINEKDWVKIEKIHLKKKKKD